MEEIIKLLCECSANGKIVDKKFLNAFFEEYINNIGLEGFCLKYLSFLTLLFKRKHGDCNWNFKKIKFVPHTIIIQECSDLIEDFTKVEISFLRNSDIIFNLLHEIFHAEDYKKCSKNETASNNPELELLKISNNYESFIIRRMLFAGNDPEDIPNFYEINRNIENRFKNYRKYYVFNPSERMPDIKALLEIMNIFNQIYLDMPHLVNLLKTFLYFAYLRGYNFELIDHLGPSFEYLSKTDNIRLWQSFEFYDPNREVLIHKVTSAYNLEDRLYLGLPVMKEETDDIVKLVHSKFKGVSN